jgi:hypothetical protein
LIRALATGGSLTEPNKMGAPGGGFFGAALVVASLAVVAMGAFGDPNTTAALTNGSAPDDSPAVLRDEDVLADDQDPATHRQLQSSSSSRRRSTPTPSPSPPVSTSSSRRRSSSSGAATGYARVRG